MCLHMKRTGTERSGVKHSDVIVSCAFNLVGDMTRRAVDVRWLWLVKGTDRWLQ